MIGIGKNEAKKVVLCPADESTQITAPSISALKRNLVGRTVAVGDEIPVSELRRKVAKSAGFEEFDNFFEDVLNIDTPLKVIETDPEGEVKITGDTQIVILESVPDEYGLPIARILNVKTRPNVNSMLEVKDIDSMKKLAKNTNYFINRYEDDNEIIYFIGEYYYRITK